MTPLPLHTSLLYPDISYWASWTSTADVLVEACENYQKRSGRNRMSILGPQGSQPLSIPLKSGKHEQQPIREVLISPDYPWRRTLLRSLRAAYGRAPYYEHYIDPIRSIIEYPSDKLWDYNLNALLEIAQLIGLSLRFIPTDRYYADYSDQPHILDYRHIKPRVNLEPYAQPWADRLGWNPDVSILDLIFCLGPATAPYLAQYDGSSAD